MLRGSKAEPLRQSRAFGQQSFRKGPCKSVFGLHRRKRSAFLPEIGKVRRSPARPGLGAAKHHTLKRKASKSLHKGVDRTVFGPRRRERIAFLAKSGEAGLRGRKPGLGRSKKKHFRETSAKMDETNACLDRPSLSGSRFLQKTAKHGLAAVKQGRGAADQCIL